MRLCCGLKFIMFRVFRAGKERLAVRAGKERLTVRG
jgi:hypothetical protein